MTGATSQRVECPADGCSEEWTAQAVRERRVGDDRNRCPGCDTLLAVCPACGSLVDFHAVLEAGCSSCDATAGRCFDEASQKPVATAHPSDGLGAGEVL